MRRPGGSCLRGRRGTAFRAPVMWPVCTANFRVARKGPFLFSRTAIKAVLKSEIVPVLGCFVQLSGSEMIASALNAYLAGATPTDQTRIANQWVCARKCR